MCSRPFKALIVCSVKYFESRSKAGQIGCQTAGQIGCQTAGQTAGQEQVKQQVKSRSRGKTRAGQTSQATYKLFKVPLGVMHIKVCVYITYMLNEPLIGF